MTQQQRQNMNADTAARLILWLEEDGHLSRLHDAQVGNLWTTSIPVLEQLERRINEGE